MSIRVLLPNAFQKHTAGAREHASSAENLNSLLDDLSATYPALATHIRDNDGHLRGFINVYVNEEDIRFLGDAYTFQEGDEVLLIPSIAGGSTGAAPFYGSGRGSCACGAGTCRCCPANRCCTATCCCCSETAY